MRRAGSSIVLAVMALACDRAPASSGAPSRGKPRPPPRAPARPAPPATGCPTLAPAAPGQAAADPAPLAASSIAINLPIALASIQPELDRLIPNLSDPDWNQVHKVADGMCATWYFDRKRLALRMDGSRLRITIPGGFGMIAGPHTEIFGCTRPFVSCGDKTAGAAPVAIQLQLSTDLAIAASYRLAVALTNDGTTFVQPCNLMGNVVDATPQVGAIIDGQIAQQLAALNTAIAAKADARPRIEAAWTAIQRPQRIADDLWLVVHPTDLAGAIAAADPGTLSIQAVARGTIELVKQPAAPAVTATPLPALVPAPPGIAPGIHVGASGTISYDALTRQLQAELSGKPQDIEYPAGVRHHAVVRDVRVSGPVKCKNTRRAATCVSLAIEFTGDACGAIYLVGRPAVDPDKQEIAIQDLELSVESSDAVIKQLAWLAHGALVDQVGRRARVSLASAASEAKQRLNQALRSKLAGDWRLSGSADTVGFHVAIGSTGLDYAIDLSGTLAVALSAP